MQLNSGSKNLGLTILPLEISRGSFFSQYSTSYERKRKKWKPLTNSILRSSLYEINWSWKICEKLPYIFLYLAPDQLSKELLLGIYIYKVHVFEPACQPQSELVKKAGPAQPERGGGAIAPLQSFGWIRDKTCSIKRPFITDSPLSPHTQIFRHSFGSVDTE